MIKKYILYGLMVNITLYFTLKKGTYDTCACGLFLQLAPTLSVKFEMKTTESSFLHISKRGFIRLFSFLIALVLVSALLIYKYYRESENSKLILEYQYLQDVENLAQYSESINNSLNKMLYSNSPQMLSALSSKLWREASLAKESLDRLPIEYTKLQNTNKLLSQVGDYCVSTSKLFAKGEPITKEQRNNLLKLQKYCDSMTREVITMSDSIRTNSLCFDTVKGNINRDFDKQPAPAHIAEGFSELEEGFTSYPTLIYDGPFSDHIMQRKSIMLKDMKDITREQALKIAQNAMGTSVALTNGEDESSAMAAYGFSAENGDIAITKKGGLISYFLKYRDASDVKLSTAKAQEIASNYLLHLGIENMQTTYYEITNNIITINYAAKQEFFDTHVVLYPDLIKVGVAMDNGEIISFDARGYIVNHYKRTIASPRYSMEVCKLALSDFLTPSDGRLVIIPSDGLSETLCYEFKCKSDDGKDLLVYVNANTKQEEQILILLISESGILTV